MYGLSLSSFGQIGTIILFFVLPGLIGMWIAKSKGRSSGLWFIACTVFPLLVIVIAILRPAGEVYGKLRACPKCKEIIHWEATKCRYCGSDIEPVKLIQDGEMAVIIDGRKIT